MSSTLIIAEAGVNHNGSMEIARKLIDAAADAGVDYVKFQTFKAENLVSRSAPKADYQKRNTENGNDSQFDMLKALELTIEQHHELIRHCKARQVNFLSTAFDMESVDFLISLDLPLWKIASGEITNYPYLRKIGQTRKPVILSTGMADTNEIRQAVSVLQHFGTPQITLLHCTTEYPAPMKEINLRAIETLCTMFDTRVGYSDHSQGIEIAVAAVALGAVVIEKHFTLDRTLPGPDHKASLEPDQLREMVRHIRNVEQAMGDGTKVATPCEIKNRKIARKSIVAKGSIKKGETFGEQNLTVKRPEGGISPMEWENIIGKIAKRDFADEEPIEL